MCLDCVKEQRPDRGNVTAEVGALLANFKACAKCNVRGPLAVLDREVEEEDDEDEYQETITFQHQCKNCQHVVCEHYYSFRVVKKTQEYLMECFLCGRGSHTAQLDITEAKQPSSSAAASVSACAHQPFTSDMVKYATGDLPPAAQQLLQEESKSMQPSSQTTQAVGSQGAPPLELKLDLAHLSTQLRNTTTMVVDGGKLRPAQTLQKDDDEVDDDEWD